MRPLTKNEVRLLIILVGVLLLVGSLLLIRAGFHSANKCHEDIDFLKARYENHLRLRQQGDYWEARKTWIQQNPPPIYDSSRSESQFVEAIQSSLKEAGLSIAEQQLKGSSRKDEFIVTLLTIKVTGDLRNLIEWMVTHQKAGNYFSISKLNLKADTSKMVVTAELSQFFSLPHIP